MITLKDAEIHNKFNTICDLALTGETVVIFRPNNQNVVVVSELEYNNMAKAIRNNAYMDKIDKSVQELKEKKVVVKTLEELEEMTG